MERTRCDGVLRNYRQLWESCPKNYKPTLMRYQFWTPNHYKLLNTETTMILPKANDQEQVVEVNL